MHTTKEEAAPARSWSSTCRHKCVSCFEKDSTLATAVVISDRGLGHQQKRKRSTCTPDSTGLPCTWRVRAAWVLAPLSLSLSLSRHRDTTAGSRPRRAPENISLKRGQSETAPLLLKPARGCTRFLSCGCTRNQSRKRSLQPATSSSRCTRIRLFIASLTTTSSCSRVPVS